MAARPRGGDTDTWLGQRSNARWRCDRHREACELRWRQRRSGCAAGAPHPVALCALCTARPMVWLEAQALLERLCALLRESVQAEEHLTAVAPVPAGGGTSERLELQASTRVRSCMRLLTLPHGSLHR